MLALQVSIFFSIFIFENVNQLLNVFYFLFQFGWHLKLLVGNTMKRWFWIWNSIYLFIFSRTYTEKADIYSLALVLYHFVNINNSIIFDRLILTLHIFKKNSWHWKSRLLRRMRWQLANALSVDWGILSISFWMYWLCHVSYLDRQCRNGCVLRFVIRLLYDALVSISLNISIFLFRIFNCFVI